MAHENHHHPRNRGTKRQALFSGKRGWVIIAILAVIVVLIAVFAWTGETDESADNLPALEQGGTENPGPAEGAIDGADGGEGEGLGETL